MEKERIILSHGSGGKLSKRLVEEVFLRAFTNPLLSELNDQAVFDLPHSKLALTTDSYVVNPIFFPGGDIGKLSVCGTINDLAVGGAEPVYMSASFIIEEGLPLEDLRRVVESMARTAREAGVKIVTGDTKVVERGKGDKLFINTTGLGVVSDGLTLGPGMIRPGDVILVSGTIGDHGVAILAGREGMEMEIPVESDCAPLAELVTLALAEGGVKAMRDPTRGGLATILNELASQSGAAMVIDEEKVPVREEVRGACEILGFDPLYLANEGKAVIIAEEKRAGAVLAALKGHPLGKGAAVIGRVTEAPAGKVILTTAIGSRRILDMLSGEQLPRIC